MINVKTNLFFTLVMISLCSSCLKSSSKQEVRGPSADGDLHAFLDQDSELALNFSIEEDDTTLFSQQAPIRQFEDDQYLYYSAAPGETLMLLAFRFYTDHQQWRKIYRANADKLGSSPDIQNFIELRIPKPLSQYREPAGMPYLIKPGDSLSLISKKVYGTMSWWEEIWHNNPRMITNPNLIFAGFTLFYPDKNAEKSNTEYFVF